MMLGAYNNQSCVELIPWTSDFEFRPTCSAVIKMALLEHFNGFLYCPEAKAIFYMDYY